MIYKCYNYLRLNYYFLKALVKKWSALKIPVSLEYILEKAYALAHLPSNLISEGFEHIVNLIDGLTLVDNINDEDVNALQAFSTYLRTYWIPLADVVSVFEKPVRTNNTCENFHLYAGRRLGYRTNIYKFLDKFLFPPFISCVYISTLINFVPTFSS